MAAYEVLLLNTAIPQIQAAQSGDTYIVPRDIAINATAIISANSATDALRITQTGAGNALLVEDSANPDSTPFVVTAAGDVGVGASSPGYALDVQKSVANGVVANFQSTSTSAVNTGVAFRSSASNAANRNWALLANSSAFGDFVIRTSTTNGGDPVSGTDRLMIDPSGNLGLGVTPSVWGSGYAALQIKQTALYTTATEVELGSNHFVNSSGQFAYIGNGFATRYEQYLGAHSWHTAPNNTSGAGFAPISFTQAMTLDASGNLLVGTTSRLVNYGHEIVVNGTAGEPEGFVAIRGERTADGNLGALKFYNYSNSMGGISARRSGADNSSALTFSTSNAGSDAERARITSGGDFGIGTTNPSSKFEVRFTGNSYGYFSNTGDNNTGVRFQNTGREYAIFVDGGSGSGNPLRFYDFTAGSERARITSGGSFLVGGGLTAPLIASDFIASFTGGQGLSVQSTGGTGYYPLVCWNNATSGDNAFAAFGTEGTYTARGSITYNRTAGLVAYNTTSDYRAKDIIGPVANPGATIDALKVYEGKMKGATQSRPMLVAHEAQEHVPYAVTGEKDAVNEDGTPKYQQMDVSSLVPLLLAEIQSLRARVKALEGA